MNSLLDTVGQFAPLMADMATEPYFVDDIMRHLSPAEMLQVAMPDAELFLNFIGGQVVCMAMIRNIRHLRDATFEGWGHPGLRQSYRGQKIEYKFAKEVMEYAFKPWSHGNIKTDGLGLLKLQVEVSIKNYPALRASRALGFRPIAQIPFGAFFGGVPSDTVLLEVYNPALYQVQTQGILSSEVEQSKEHAVDTGTGIQGSASVSDGADRHTGSPEPERDNQGGELRGGSGGDDDSQPEEWEEQDYVF